MPAHDRPHSGTPSTPFAALGVAVQSPRAIAPRTASQTHEAEPPQLLMRSAVLLENLQDIAVELSAGHKDAAAVVVDRGVDELLALALLGLHVASKRRATLPSSEFRISRSSSAVSPLVTSASPASTGVSTGVTLSVKRATTRGALAAHPGSLETKNCLMAPTFTAPVNLLKSETWKLHRYSCAGIVSTRILY